MLKKNSFSYFVSNLHHEKLCKNVTIPTFYYVFLWKSYYIPNTRSEFLVVTSATSSNPTP